MKVFSGLAGIAALLACLSAAGCATTPPAGKAKEGEGASCELTCVQWDNQCDIDSRGVTTCRHVCRRMGKQCL